MISISEVCWYVKFWTTIIYTIYGNKTFSYVQAEDSIKNSYDLKTEKRKIISKKPLFWFRNTVWLSSVFFS